MKLFDRLLKSVRGKDKETSLKDCLANFSRGYGKCEGCKALVPIGNLSPLTLDKCPACGVLFFVPAQLEGWVVCKPLGVGGEGGVFLACSGQDPNLKAAVKILRKDAQTPPEAVENFLRESKIGASLGTHPRLMRVYVYGYLNDGAFMITQFVEGATLGDLLNDYKDGLPPEVCLYYAIDLIEALEHIYDCGYVYRDLNLRNIIIGDDGFATLIDYGLCMTHDEAWEIRDGRVFGTPLFIAPERCLKMGEDVRSDIYSLGMVLYYALTGRPYFSPTEVEQVIKGHLRGVRVSTSAKMVHTDPDLAKVVDLMIKRDREERVQDYDDIRAMIYPILARHGELDIGDPIIKMRRKHFAETHGGK